jgi:hypothetical protein
VRDEDLAKSSFALACEVIGREAEFLDAIHRTSHPVDPTARECVRLLCGILIRVYDVVRLTGSADAGTVKVLAYAVDNAHKAVHGGRGASKSRATQIIDFATAAARVKAKRADTRRREL